MSDSTKRVKSKDALERRSGMPLSRIRGFVALAVVVFTLLGLALHKATGTASALGIDSIALICPLGSLEAMLGSKEIMLHPVILLTITLVVVVLVGKAFCSWICPIPWIRRFFKPEKKRKEKHTDDSNDGLDTCQDVAVVAESEELSNVSAETLSCTECNHVVPHSQENALGERDESETCDTHKALAPVGGKRDGVHLDSRHAVLVGALASTAVFGFPVFCLICPIGLSFATLIGLWNLFRFNEPSWGLIIFPIILIIEVVVLRKWCSKICPVSALVSLISRLNKTFKPKVDTSKCVREQGIDCHKCVESCPEEVDPHNNLIPECSKCGACVEACPAHAISIKLLSRSR